MLFHDAKIVIKQLILTTKRELRLINYLHQFFRCFFSRIAVRIKCVHRFFFRNDASEFSESIMILNPSNVINMFLEAFQTTFRSRLRTAKSQKLMRSMKVRTGLKNHILEFA